MSKTQKTENYIGLQNISSYIAGMVPSLTSVNPDSLVFSEIIFQYDYIKRR